MLKQRSCGTLPEICPFPGVKLVKTPTLYSNAAINPNALLYLNQTKGHNVRNVRVLLAIIFLRVLW